MSLRADAYTEPEVGRRGLKAIFARTWQWVCHVEKLTAAGSYVSATVAGMPIAIVRDRGGDLRAFYNVCKHRAHELLSGSGTTRSIVCPYHAWTYDLDGQLKRPAGPTGWRPSTGREICLDQIQVEEFGGFVYVNLDPSAAPSAASRPGIWRRTSRAGRRTSPSLTHAKRLTYDVRDQLEERRRQLPGVLPLPRRPQGVRRPRRHGHLRGDRRTASGRATSPRRASTRTRPTTCPARRSPRTPSGGCGPTPACCATPAAATSWSSRSSRPDPTARWRPGTSTSRPPSSATPRSSRCSYIDEVLQAAGHQPRGERPARHAHPRVRPGPHRLRPCEGSRSVRARRAPLPRAGARRLPTAGRWSQTATISCGRPPLAAAGA